MDGNKRELIEWPKAIPKSNGNTRTYRDPTEGCKFTRTYRMTYRDSTERLKYIRTYRMIYGDHKWNVSMQEPIEWLTEISNYTRTCRMTYKDSTNGLKYTQTYRGSHKGM